MLSGDNGILQKATTAKEHTERAEIIENAKMDVLAEISDNKGNTLKESQLQSVLGKYFINSEIPEELPSDLESLELTTLNNKYRIKVSEIYDGTFEVGEHIMTIGKAYQDSWIGKQITYTANNEYSDWIILGKDKNGDILITTANPVGRYNIPFTISAWCNAEKNLNDACSEYTGKIGKNNVDIKEIRNITLDDVNNAVGFNVPEPLELFTFGEQRDYSNHKVNYYYPDQNTITWKKPSSTDTWTHNNDAYYYCVDNGNYLYYYPTGTGDYQTENYSTKNLTLSKEENMKYIIANKQSYWLATRSMELTKDHAIFYVDVVKGNPIRIGRNHANNIASTSEGPRADDSDSDSYSFRPVAVISSKLPYDDIEIGNYWTY